MTCPYCSGDTQVFNSRLRKRSNQVWRRRRCLGCGAIFTSVESIDLPSVFVVGDGNTQKPFRSEILFNEMLACLRGRENAFDDAHELTATVTQKLQKNARNGLISPQKISSEAAEVLKRFDKQAYLRFTAEHPSLQS